MRQHSTDLSNAKPLPMFDAEWEKGVVYTFGDIFILIEFLAGDIRTKVSGSGFTVSNTMPAAYGYILRTNDAHGEEIDVYIASMAKPENDVYVIDQVNPNTGCFDEHKVMLGFDCAEEAAHLYTTVFSDNSGPKRLGAITGFTPSEFTIWLTTDGTALRPASDCQIDNISPATQIVAGINPTPRPDADTPARRDTTGGVIVDLPSLSEGPKIKTTSLGDGFFVYDLYLYSGINIMEWSNLVDVFCRTLDLATEGDSVHIHIASPGGSVMLMGRMISAMARTKAKVYTYAKGSVASAATAIWSAGHERHILPAAFFMQHMSSQLLAGKTTDIAAKSIFGVSYIEEQLRDLVTMGLFTQDEVSDMTEKSADVYISGREAVTRMGKVSTSA